MKIKKTVGDYIFDTCNALIMIFVVIATLYPFWYVITCSLSESNFLVGNNSLMLLPQGFTLDSYKAVFKNPNIVSGYATTIFLVVVGTAVNMIMTILGAYVLSKKNFALKRAMMIMVVFTMYFGGGMIPSYLLVYNYLHLGNSLWALILPSAISTYNLIVLRTNFMGIPDSLSEAARIDGANDWIILFRIVLPLSMSGLAVVGLFYGVGRWNSWFDALIYIRDRNKYPLQLILREILLMNDTSKMMSEAASTSERYSVGESIKYATIMVATLPILAVYPFIQKYFVKGVMVGAVKG